MTEKELNEILYEDSFPENFKSPEGVSEKRSSLSHPLGNMNVHETWFEGVMINHGVSRIYDELHVNMETDAPIIEMHFSLAGNTGVRFSGYNALPEGFGKAEHNIIYTPGFKGDLRLKASPEGHHFFEVHLTEAFFKKLVLEECHVLSALVRHIERKEIAALSKRNLSITTRMNSIIHDIMHCKRKGSIQRIYLEAKVLELLMLQAEQYEGSLVTRKQPRLQAPDIEKLHYARWILEQQPDVTHSLKGLAKATGLNEYRLKQGFKELWGATVFGFLHQLRMEQARLMLLEQGKTVGEVADYAGYKNPHHFTASFKKHFGCLPREVKTRL